MFAHVSNLFRSKKNQHMNETSVKLFTLKLSNVMNCFDAHSLWEHRYGSQKDLVESSSQKSDFRLKNALDRYRRVVNTSGQGKWMMKTEKVFSDVILWIPEAVWQNDIEVGANSIAMLADSLSRFHTDDFQKDLFEQRLPAYIVMPDATLGQGEVRFQFGMGVYVPKTDEVPIAEIEIKMQGQNRWKKLPEWYFWRDSLLIKKPVGIYQGQQGIIIGADQDAAAVAVNGDSKEFPWFSDSRGEVFINYALQSINYAFGDGKHISRNSEIDSKDEQTGQIVFKFTAVNPESEDPELDGRDSDDQVLLLKITPLDIDRQAKKTDTQGQNGVPPFPLEENDVQIADTDKKPAQKKKESRKEGGEQDKTNRSKGIETIVVKENSSGFETILIGPDSFDQDESAPFAGVPHMYLEGYALPRIDRFKIPGLDSWEIWLGKEGNVIDRPAEMDNGSFKPDAEQLAVSGTRFQNGLYIVGQQSTEPVLIEHFPKTLSMGSGLEYVIDKLPENEYYAGVIRIPKPDRFFSIENQKLTLGRGDLVDVQMDLLTQTEFLRWENKKEQKEAYMGLINLSRDHAELILKDNNLEVINISQSSPLFILRQDDTLEKIKQNSPETLLMKPGERLLMGCCLLRYENDGVKDKTPGFSLSEFTGTQRFKLLIDRVKSGKKLPADEHRLIEHIQKMIHKYRDLDNISSISPEVYIRDLDQMEAFLKFSDADKKDMDSIKKAKINYLNRFK